MDPIKEPLLPPPGWIPPTYKRRLKFRKGKFDISEWSNFSWWFNRYYLSQQQLDTTALEDDPNPNRLLHHIPKTPIHIKTTLKWSDLCEAMGKPCKTNPNKVEESASLLPLACSATPVSWSSSDGVKLAYYLPNALDHVAPSDLEQSKTLKQVGLDAIVGLVKTHKPRPPKSDAKRYGKRFVKMAPKDWTDHCDNMEAKHWAWGRYIFGLWHAQGQTHSAPSLSMDQFKSSARVQGTFEFYPEFAPIFQAMGRIYQEIDPWAYLVYRNNYDYWASERYYMNEVMKVSGRCCFLSTALLINQHVLPHKDGNDIPGGWVGMTVFGSFTGGFLCLPDLNIKVPFQPGDVVYFRSAVLEHYVTDFVGQRYSCVLFTKASVHDKQAMDSLWSAHAHDKASSKDEDKDDEPAGSTHNNSQPVNTGPGKLRANAKKRMARKTRAKRKKRAEQHKKLDDNRTRTQQSPASLNLDDHTSDTPSELARLDKELDDMVPE